MAVTTAPDAAAGSAPAKAPAARKTSLWTRLAYGVGYGAIGVKDNGFSYFLLMFYSQVIGLDARLVGLALTAALVVDAFVDPMIGYWSDNLRSRWGRRRLGGSASSRGVSSNAACASCRFTTAAGTNSKTGTRITVWRRTSRFIAPRSTSPLPLC